MDRWLNFSLLFSILTIFSISNSAYSVCVDGDCLENIEYASVQNAPRSDGRMCVYWQKSDGVSVYSHCSPYKLNYCGQQLKYDYRCCSGYRESQAPFVTQNQCMATYNTWATCVDFLSSFGGMSEFAKKLQPSLLKNSKSGVTILAPYVSNEYHAAQFYTGSRQFILDRYYSAAEFQDGMLLPILGGANQYGSVVVSKYSNGMICLDCSELIETDLACREGIVHLIRRPLLNKAAAWKTLASALQQPDFSHMGNSLSSELRNKLSVPIKGEFVGSNKLYTVFVFVGQAAKDEWQTYSAKQRQALAEYHVVEGLYCSVALSSQQGFEIKSAGGTAGMDVHCNSKSVDMDSAQFSGWKKDSGEQRYITDMCGNVVRIVETDLMAGNGVIHKIDRPLLSPSAFSMEELIKAKRCNPASVKRGDMWGSWYSYWWWWFSQWSQWWKWMQECDLHLSPNSKYAFLMPVDGAFTWWKNYQPFSKEYNRFMNEKEYRCRTIRYHIMQINSNQQELMDFKSMPHQRTAYKSNHKMFDLYQADYFMKNGADSKFAWHYSRLADGQSHQVLNGAIYRITRINVMPELKMWQIMQSRSDLQSYWFKWLQMNSVKSSSEAMWKNKEPLNLHLAVRDEFYGSTSVQAVEAKAYDESAYSDLMKLHTIHMYLWGGDIGYFEKSTYYRFMSALGIELVFRRDQNGDMYVATSSMMKENVWAKVIEFNLHATDGIIWILNMHLWCTDPRCPQRKKPKVHFEYMWLFAGGCLEGDFKYQTKAQNLAQAKSQYSKKFIEFNEENNQYCSLHLVGPEAIQFDDHAPKRL